MVYSTEQENFWAGEFGNAYVDRNRSAELLAANLNFFARSLRQAGKLASCLEFGANIGMNLRALRLLYPHMQLGGIEINPRAAAELMELVGAENVVTGSILDWQPDRRSDLVLLKGVLIHINPEMLGDLYRRIHATSGRWILIGEYYNPSPVAIPYRGHMDRLFKRDFAGEMLDMFSDLRLVDYGFYYHRDPVFPQDDITWFLLEREI